MKTILITGAAGEVGGHLRRELAGRYQLRLSDRRPVTGLSPSERFRRGELARLADVVRVSKGVDAIVHLGARHTEGSWEQILEANIVGAYNVFEAARRNGVPRVVFASSQHALGFHRRDQRIDHRAELRPDSRYGASKAFGEVLGRLYADKYGLEVCCVRIGTVQTAPTDRRRLSTWLSPRDLGQLVNLVLEHPAIRFEIVYGVSGNQRSFYDNANALRLGYRPQDDSEKYAAEVLAHDEPSADPMIEVHQGGVFTVLENLPKPRRTKAGALSKARARPRTKR